MPLAGSLYTKAVSCPVQLCHSVTLDLTACIQGLKADKTQALFLLLNSHLLFGEIKITCVTGPPVD